MACRRLFNSAVISGLAAIRSSQGASVRNMKPPLPPPRVMANRLVASPLSRYGRANCLDLAHLLSAV
jgi:hypothetical protein